MNVIICVLWQRYHCVKDVMNAAILVCKQMRR